MAITRRPRSSRSPSLLLADVRVLFVNHGRIGTACSKQWHTHGRPAVKGHSSESQVETACVQLPQPACPAGARVLAARRMSHPTAVDPGRLARPVKESFSCKSFTVPAPFGHATDYGVHAQRTRRFGQMCREQDSFTGRTSRPGSDVAQGRPCVWRADRGRTWRGKAVRLATKTSAPAGQAGGGRFDDLSCRGSIRSLWPSGKLPLRPHGCPCLTRGQP